MGLIVNWAILLAAVLLIFAGLYLVIKMAVKNAIRESFREIGQKVANELWKDED